MKIICICLGAMLLAISPAFASITALKCTFRQEGIITQWNEDGKNKVEKGMYDPQEKVATLVFSQIDEMKRSAVASDKNSSMSVAVVNSQDILSFFEITPNGNQVLTSVYVGAPLKDKSFPAVISRHLTRGRPLVSQFYGTCTTDLKK